MEPLAGCKPLDIVRLPDGPGALQDDFYLQQALQVVEEKKRKITTDLTSIERFGEFSDGVAEITALFRALTLAEDRIRPRARNREIDALDQVKDTTLPIIQHLFTERLKQQAETALASFAGGNFALAETQFNMILTALTREQGQDRFFYFQANHLVALIRQKEKIKDAITLMLALEQRVPYQFQNWLNQIRESVKQYLDQEFRNNESQVDARRKEIDAHVTTVEGTLSTQKLQQTTNFLPHLAVLSSIYKSMKTLGEQISLLERRCGELSELLGLLEIQKESAIEQVKDHHRKWRAIVSSAGNLLSDLRPDHYVYQQNQILHVWIKKHIALYKGDKLTALHAWAFSLLGKTFIPCYIGQADLNKTVTLFRQNWQTLSQHRAHLQHDVRVANGRRTINESLLTLAAMSEKLRREHATSTTTGQGSVWESTPLWISKPRVVDLDLHKMVQRALPHIHELPAVLDLLFPTQATLPQNGEEQPLTSHEVEQIVALFEIAHFLEMPKEIMSQMLESRLRQGFDDYLTAIQWLRFAPARGKFLPYLRLEQLFKTLSKDEVFAWLRMYKEDPVIIDQKEHYRLFFILVDWAMAYEQARIPLSSEERAEFFQFLAGLYLFLQRAPVQFDKRIKNKLDQLLVQFGAACIAAGLDLKQHQGILIHVTYFTTDSMQKDTSGNVQGWLEQSVFPTIRELVITGTLETAQFMQCQQVTHLSLVGKQTAPWNDLKSTFLALRHLHLDGRNSDIDLAGLDKIPLVSLSLKNVQNLLDFTKCPGFKTNLEELSFHKASPVEGSLAVLIHKGILKSLKFSEIESPIGRLAPEGADHHRPSLESLDFENVLLDNSLKRSLPSLIKSQSKLSSITLRCQGAQFLLFALTDVRGKLALSWNSKGRLEQFLGLTHLESLTFFITNPQEAVELPERSDVAEVLDEPQEPMTVLGQIQPYPFDGLAKLAFIECVFPNGKIIIRGKDVSSL